MVRFNENVIDFYLCLNHNLRLKTMLKYNSTSFQVYKLKSKYTVRRATKLA